MKYRSGSKWVLAVAALPLLAGCGGAGDALGINKRPPDEFTVVSKPPLVMPPDYRLRPPDAANPRPQTVDSESMAVDALFPGRTEVPPAPSKGELSLLKAAGAQAATSDVRSNLSDDVDTVVPKGHLTKDILKSGPVEEETAKVVRLEPEPVQ